MPLIVTPIGGIGRGGSSSEEKRFAGTSEQREFEP